MIAEFLGKKLTEVDYIVHSIGQSAPTLLSCELTFGSGIVFIRNGADGQTLIAESQRGEVFDLGEYGMVNRLSSDTYDPGLANRCIGRRFDRYRLLLERCGGLRAIELGFEGQSVGFHNDDDEFRCIRSLADVAEPEGCTVVGWCED